MVYRASATSPGRFATVAKVCGIKSRLVKVVASFDPRMLGASARTLMGLEKLVALWKEQPQIDAID